jgi:hypothetical protein
MPCAGIIEMYFGGSYIITGSLVEGIGNEWSVGRFPNSRINMVFCGAEFRPGKRGPFVSAKVAKTIDAPSGLIREKGHHLTEGGPTRKAQTRPAGGWERPFLGPDGRRRPWKTTSGSLMKERKSPIKDSPILPDQATWSKRPAKDIQ